MTLAILPAVGKSFITFCNKCNGDKFHTVIAHMSTDSAKIMCDICKKKSTHKIGSRKSPLESKNQIGLKAGAVKPSRAKSLHTIDEHNKIYLKLLEETQDKEAVGYSIRSDFGIKQKIQHAKFGIGVVTRVLDDRVEVAFSDEVRQLVHRRT